MSPSLFTPFIADLAAAFINPFTIMKFTFNADDVVVFLNKGKGIYVALNILSHRASEAEMRINTAEMNINKFRRGDKLKIRQIRMFILYAFDAVAPMLTSSNLIRPDRIESQFIEKLQNLSKFATSTLPVSLLKPDPWIQNR